jgi:hypothetical protein
MYHPDVMRALAEGRADDLRRTAERHRRGSRGRGRRRGLRGLFTLHV